jgi:hypothetical protein
MCPKKKKKKDDCNFVFPLFLSIRAPPAPPAPPPPPPPPPPKNAPKKAGKSI